MTTFKIVFTFDVFLVLKPHALQGDMHFIYTLKLSSLFSKKKPETVRKLCKLIDIINKKISSP
jgi:hypothetical protein